MASVSQTANGTAAYSNTSFILQDANATGNYAGITQTANGNGTNWSSITQDVGASSNYANVDSDRCQRYSQQFDGVPRLAPATMRA